MWRKSHNTEREKQQIVLSANVNRHEFPKELSLQHDNISLRKMALHFSITKVLARRHPYSIKKLSHAFLSFRNISQLGPLY